MNKLNGWKFSSDLLGWKFDQIFKILFVDWWEESSFFKMVCGLFFEFWWIDW